MQGWVYKEEMKKVWLPIVKSLSLEDVIESLPEEYKHKYSTTTLSPLNFDFSQTQSIIKYFDRNLGSSHQKLVGSINNSSIYVSRKAKRVTKKLEPRKHHVEIDYVINVARKRWNDGLPIELERLVLMLVSYSKQLNTNREFINSYCRNDHESLKKARIFVQRALAKNEMTVRKKTVSQSIPRNWKDVAITSSNDIRQSFRNAGVSVVLSADETFIKFHESSHSCVAPVGVKRVGYSAKEKNKSGVTLLPTLDMTASRLLPPLIIFKAKFGSRLMKKWSTYTKSFVLFTETHWMTKQVMLLYFEYLMKFYPNTKIGLIIDSVQQHVSNQLYGWLQILNEENKYGSQIYLAFIEKGLTAIYQPGDVTINKPLKQEIRRRYYDFVSRQYDKIREERKINVSREQLVNFIEDAFNQINSQQIRNRTIAESFNICGLNPYSDDLTAFHRHLDSLEENKCYAAMIEKRTALDLK